MPLQVGSIISRAEYNSIQAKIESVLGDNGVDPEFGYGRALESSQITTSKVIESEDMLALYNDLVKARTHQKGSNNLAWTGDGLAAPSDEEFIGVFAADIGANPLDPDDISSQYASADTTEGFADFDSAADDIVTDHDLIGPGQMSIMAGTTSVRDTEWGGNDVSAPGSSINHTITVTWQNADERRYFFNTGGELQFSADNQQSIALPDNAKTLNWRSMLSTQGAIVFGKSSTAASGTNPGSGSSIGNFYSQWSNTSSSNPVTIYTKSGSGVYAENNYTIKAWETASNSLRFDIIFQDADLGEGGPAPDTPVDEFVKGETSSYLNYKVATGLGLTKPANTNNSTLSGSATGQSNLSISVEDGAGNTITQVDEGGTVVFKVETVNIATGTEFSYTISGTNVQQEDISLPGTSGTITIDSNGQAEVSMVITEDETTETTETLVFTVSGFGPTGISSSVTINDTSQNVQFALRAQTNSVDEGETVGYWLDSGQTELDGETIYWDIDPPAEEWVEAAGSFVYDAAATYNAANPAFTITPKLDEVLDDYYYVDVNIRRNGPDQPIISSQGINVYSTTEDPFVFKIDTATIYDGDGISSATRGNFDDKKITIYFNSDSGDYSDIQFRIRPISGGSLVSPNFTPTQYFSYTATGSSTSYASVTWEFSSATVAEVDVKGRGAFSFGTDTNFSFKDALAPGGDSSDLRDNGSKVIDVVSWGREFEFTRFDYMFNNCPLTILTDASNPFANHTVTNCAGMFYKCKDFTGQLSGLSTWDVSNVTTMNQMFLGCTSFTGPIGGWSVSNVTDMKGMFERAHLFNTNIGGWVTSSVTDMTSMFECEHNNTTYPPSDQGTFNQDISGWDVTSVTGMNRMFFNHQGFNQSLTSWCVDHLGGTNEPVGFNGGESVLTNANLPVWGTCGGVVPAGSVPITFEIIGGGGGGAGQSDQVGQDPNAPGDAGGTSSITFSSAVGLSNATSAGGTGGTYFASGRAGDASAYGPGGTKGADSGSTIDAGSGGNAPVTSYGAGGGGAGQGYLQSGAEPAANGGDGGGAATRITRGQEYGSEGTATIVIGEKGLFGQSTNLQLGSGGFGAPGYCKLTTGTYVREYTEPGTYNINIVANPIEVTYEIIGGGGSGGGGWNNGTPGVKGDDSTISSTDISVISEGGAGGIVVNGTSTAGQSSAYGSGGAAGANSDSNNQTAGSNAPAASFGAGGGGGGSNPFGSTAGQGGGASIQKTGTVYAHGAQTLTITIGAGGPRGPSAGTEGGSGAGGYAAITINGGTGPTNGNTYTYNSPGTYTLNIS